MRTIQNAVRRILIIVNLCAIKDALLRLLPKRTPPAVEQSEPAVEFPPQAEQVYDEDNDVNARFAAWEEAATRRWGRPTTASGKVYFFSPGRRCYGHR